MLAHMRFTWLLLRLLIPPCRLGQWPTVPMLSVWSHISALVLGAPPLSPVPSLALGWSLLAQVPFLHQSLPGLLCWDSETKPQQPQWTLNCISDRKSQLPVVGTLTVLPLTRKSKAQRG